MHGAYRRKFGPENVTELSKNIIVQHDDFLKQDDPDKKADALRYMAGYAAQYLHLVPQDKKFTFKETERVLHNSAMNIADFDPREGSLSFRNLARYAENLLEQPWRKDFHVIKLTSGFYVHNVAAQLQNAHEILIAAGYVNLDDITLKLLPTTSYNILKAISRDCYIASQECLILSQIWQHVADQEPDYPLTTGEVFEYRKNHLGDTETICNKLLFDIRARMHLVKQAKQQQLQQYNAHLQNSQRFVPVDRLIDYDPEEGRDDPDNLVSQNIQNFIPEREVERTQELLKRATVNGYGYQEEEHIYDPVYSGPGEVPVPNHQHRQHQQKQVGNVPQYFYNPNPPKMVAPLSSQVTYAPYQAPQLHNNFNNSGYDASRNSMSPMIPKTVTSCFTNGRNNVSKSNSLNSINGSKSSSSSSASQQPALTQRRVKETDLDSVVDLMMQESQRNSQRQYFPKENGTDVSGRSVRARKSMPSSSAFHQQNNQVYADEYYPNQSQPGIVKPVPVYGNPVSNPPIYMRTNRLPSAGSDNSEDVLNDAHAYASQVSQLSRGVGPHHHVNDKPYQHQATPIPIIGSDSDYSISSESRSRGGSVRRDGGSLEKKIAKRPSHIELKPAGMGYADSSPEEMSGHHQKNKNGYRELGSSSSGDSPITRGYPRNENLSSLDTVYYDYLLKKGHTDEILGNNSATSPTNQEERKVNAHSSHNRIKSKEGEPEENHLYDGRRVIPKKKVNPGSGSGRRKQNFREEVTGKFDPGHNHNLLGVVEGNKPSLNEKVVERQPVESEVPLSPPKQIVPWDCRHCTFRNFKEERICEVCAKSKDYFEEEAEKNQTIAMEKALATLNTNIASSQPTVSRTEVDGRRQPKENNLEDEEEQVECPQCTLLNPRRARICDACNYRLKPVEMPKVHDGEPYDIR